MDEASALADGRRVTLLPRNGGHSWAGTVHDWSDIDGHVVAEIDVTAAAATSLDHHQVWLSTVSRIGDEHGVTIFAGSAHAVGFETLALDGVVRLADERRRREVRASGSLVILPNANGSNGNGSNGNAAAVVPPQPVEVIDLSRGAVRLPVGQRGWTYGDPLDMVVQLGESETINVVGHLRRHDPDTNSVVLCFDDLPQGDAEALDRFVLAQLPIE